LNRNYRIYFARFDLQWLTDGADALSEHLLDR